MLTYLKDEGTGVEVEWDELVEQIGCDLYKDEDLLKDLKAHPFVDVNEPRTLITYTHEVCFILFLFYLFGGRGGEREERKREGMRGRRKFSISKLKKNQNFLNFPSILTSCFQT